MRLYLLIVLGISIAARAEFSGQHIGDRGSGVGVKVEAGAVQGTATGTINVESGAIKGDATLHAEPGAVNCPVSVRGTGILEPGAVPVTVSASRSGNLTVVKGAIPVEVRTQVAKDAVNLTLSINVQPGAVQVRGAEVQAGAFQIPWYVAAIGAAALLLVFVIGHWHGRKGGE